MHSTNGAFSLVGATRVRSQGPASRGFRVDWGTMRTTWLCLLASLLLASCGRDGVGLLGEGTGLGDGGPGPTDGAGPVPDGLLARKDGSVPDGDLAPDASRLDGGLIECQVPRDCLDQRGQPPPCPNGPSVWSCNAGGFCEVDCNPSQCRTDCDCPPEYACVAPSPSNPISSCQAANRRNLCCTNPMCPPGESCIELGGGRSMCPLSQPDAGPRPDGGPTPDGGTPDAGTATPVGDPCAAQNVCGPIGFCIDSSQGFPDGYCSQDCSMFGSPCPAGSACRGFGGGNAVCLGECASNAECRMGYLCVQLGLDPQRVCWPNPGGSMNPNGEGVGGACTGDEDCQTGLTCLNFQGWPGGYCTKQLCDPTTNPCPSGSSCFNFPDFFSLCLENCPNGGTQSTCAPGYYCLGPTGQQGACLPN